MKDDKEKQMDDGKVYLGDVYHVTWVGDLGQTGVLMVDVDSLPRPDETRVASNRMDVVRMVAVDRLDGYVIVKTTLYGDGTTWRRLFELPFGWGAGGVTPDANTFYKMLGDL
jgi:hypothetical protein